SNPRPRGRPGFRDRLRTTAHHLPSMSWLSRRDLNARRFRRAALSAELRDKVRPGGLEPPTALRSGAHDGYKPSALPIELWAQAQHSLNGQGGWIRTNGLLLPRQELWPG